MLTFFFFWQTDAALLFSFFPIQTLNVSHQSSFECQVHTCFNKFCILLCCLKTCTLRVGDNCSYLINILAPWASRHGPLTLCMLFALCTKSPLRHYSHQVHSSCSQHLWTRLVFAPSTLRPHPHYQQFTLTILPVVLRSGLFFFSLALHLISVNAQFLFSSTRHSLSSHPPSKLSVQLSV